MQSQTVVASGSSIIPRPIIIPHIDPKAVQLLESAAGKLRYARSIKAVIQVTNGTTGYIDTVWAMRPMYQFRRNYSFPRSESRNRVLITPTECIQYSEYLPRNQVHAYRCKPEWGTDNASIRAFYNLSQGNHLNAGHWDLARLTDPLLRSVIYIGKENWNGEQYDVVKWIYEQAYTQPRDTVVYTTRTFIAGDGTVRRVLTTNVKGLKQIKNVRQIDERVLELVIDAPLTIQDFALSVPAKLEIEPLKPARTFIGQKYPEFATSAYLLDGPNVTVSQLLRGKKATLVWFWNTTCGPCMSHMPQFEQLYREMKDQGVNVIAVNVVKDTQEVELARENITFNRVTMPILFNADSWGNRLMEIGTAVLDSEGRVVEDGTYDLIRIREVIERLLKTE